MVFFLINRKYIQLGKQIFNKAFYRHLKLISKPFEYIQSLDCPYTNIHANDILIVVFALLNNSFAHLLWRAGGYIGMEKATFCRFCQSNAKFKLGLKTCSFRNSSENFISLTLEAITQYWKISSACHTISYWWQFSYGTTYKMDNRFHFGFCRRAHTFAWANTPFPPQKKETTPTLFGKLQITICCYALRRTTKAYYRQTVFCKTIIS